MGYVKRINIMTVSDFWDSFNTEEKCYDYLFEKRWPEGFVCPRCKERESHFQPERKLNWCVKCGYQASVTSGTIFHSRNLPLWKWYWAIYRVAQDKKGFSAMQLMKEIGVSYPTAWYLLQKIREAMKKRDEQYMLSGTIEMDDGYVGGKEEGKIGRGSEEKVPIVVAVEERITKKGLKPGYTAIRAVPDLSGGYINKFAQSKIMLGSIIKTDGWKGYSSLSKKGFYHDIIITGGGKAAGELFPWVHVVIGNLKRFILGTHHHVGKNHIDGYIAEYAYRLNRRFHEEDLFNHLFQACLLLSPKPKESLKK